MAYLAKVAEKQGSLGKGVNSGTVQRLRSEEVTPISAASPAKMDVAGVENRDWNVPLEWQMLDSVPTGIIILDKYGLVVYQNQEALTIFEESILDRPWYEVIHSYFVTRKDDGCDLTLKSGKRVKLKTNPFNDGRCQLISLIDISDSRNYQEKISHEDRIYKTGQMVSSLAHQLRTPLSSSLIYANLIDTEQKQYQEKLIGSLQQIEKQIQNLLLHSRRETLLKESINLYKVLTSFEFQYENLFNGSIHLDVSCSERAKLVSFNGNRTALEGALSNVLNNAVEAYQGVHGEVDGLSIRVSLSAHSNRLILVIEDNGPGVSETEIKKIMEPFFSTKSNGTGLGLAVLQSVISAHSGELTLTESSMGGLKVVMEFKYD